MFEGFEKPNTNVEELSRNVSDITNQAMEAAGEKWSEIAQSDPVNRIVEESSKLADTAWAACGPAVEVGGEAVAEGAKDAVYLVGRAGLGAGELVEDTVKTPCVWVVYATGSKEVATELAQSGVMNGLADALTEYFQADERLQALGDVAETAGKVGAGIGLTLIPGNAGFAVSVAVDSLGAAGAVLESSAADGELTDEEVAASGLTAVITAGTVVANRLAQQKSAELRKPKIEQLGGSYKDVREAAPPGTETHHMPADSVNGLETKDGPCINMSAEDHRQTASFGSGREAREYRQAQADLINEGKFGEALQMDIDDIQSKFGNKYDEAIEQMLKYATEKGWI